MPSPISPAAIEAIRRWLPTVLLVAGAVVAAAGAIAELPLLGVLTPALLLLTLAVRPPEPHGPSPDEEVSLQRPSRPPAARRQGPA